MIVYMWIQTVFIAQKCVIDYMKHLMWPCLPLVEFVFVLQKVNVNYVLIHSQGISNEFADYTFKIITLLFGSCKKPFHGPAHSI